MIRLLFLCVLGLFAWRHFPETRAMLISVVEPITFPVARWRSQDEMHQVARNVAEHERLTGEIPSGPAWLGWLDVRYPFKDVALDHWGSVYQIEFSSDSIWVLSYGPDRTRRTDDDFRVVAPRR